MANAHSITTAHLACAVYGLAGSKESLSLDRFLPFPTNATQEGAKVSKLTAKTFLKLLDSGKLPNEVVSACGRFMDSISAEG